MAPRLEFRHGGGRSENARSGNPAILIDELQDTDPVQHELIARLCGDGLVRGKLFAVGDQLRQAGVVPLGLNRMARW